MAPEPELTGTMDIWRVAGVEGDIVLGLVGDTAVLACVAEDAPVTSVQLFNRTIFGPPVRFERADLLRFAHFIVKQLE